MARTKRIIQVPQPARGSYNPNRPLIKNSLLLNQVAHFQQVERESMTEGEASQYIQRMTARLHPQVQQAGGKQQ